MYSLVIVQLTFVCQRMWAVLIHHVSVLQLAECVAHMCWGKHLPERYTNGITGGTGEHSGIWIIFIFNTFQCVFEIKVVKIDE